MEERKFKVGDKVVLTTTECILFEVGDFAEVIQVDNDSTDLQYEVSNPENRDWVKESQIKLASDPETFTGLELVTMLATEISADCRLEQVGCQTWFTDEGFENLEDPDKVKQLFEKVIETEES